MAFEQMLEEAGGAPLILVGESMYRNNRGEPWGR